jgi:hypothetical protein
MSSGQLLDLPPAAFQANNGRGVREAGLVVDVPAGAEDVLLTATAYTASSSIDCATLEGALQAEAFVRLQRVSPPDAGAADAADAPDAGLAMDADAGMDADGAAVTDAAADDVAAPDASADANQPVPEVPPEAGARDTNSPRETP